MSLFSNQEPAQQDGFNYPKSLTEKYCPTSLSEFVGLDKAKNAMSKLTANPYPSAWLFDGPSGTGKTSMGLAVARMIPAELHHVCAAECDIAMIERLWHVTHYVPASGHKCHLILIDEIDRASYQSQIALLSKLDPATFFPNTIVIGTTNETKNLESRFLSRFRKLEFSSYGIASAAAELLRRVWSIEVGDTSPAPNFARMVKESNNNVRAALMALETEVMCA